MDFRRRVLTFTAVAMAILIILVFSAPFLIPYGSLTDLGGTAMFIDGGWEGTGLASIAYAIGDVFCHQMPERSFFLNGSQMPICMRDVGIITGMFIGFLVARTMGVGLKDLRIAILGLFLISVMIVEWILGTDVHFLMTSTGVLAGIGISLFLGWLLYRSEVYEGL